MGYSDPAMLTRAVQEGNFSINNLKQRMSALRMESSPQMTGISDITRMLETLNTS